MSQRHPNLLFLVTDQQQRGTLASYGNPIIQMPHLNRLAAQSTLFERAYCAQPVCGPARATLFTGTYPHWHGQITLDGPMRDDVSFLTDLIDDRWCRGFFGRTAHNCYADEPAPRADSLDEVEFTNLAPVDWLRARGIEPLNGETFTKADRPLLPEELGEPAYLAELACDFIARHAHHPFALTVSINEPHDPFSGPLNELHSVSDVTLPNNFLPPKTNQPRKALLEHLHYRNCGKEGVSLDTEEGWRLSIARYWGLCAQADRAIGRILAALDQHGIADDTLVVMTSDHGEMAGSHQLFGKNVMFDESIGVPLIMRLPGQRAGHSVPGPVSHAHVVPTILDVLGLPRPGHLQEPSLLPHLKGEQPGPTAAFAEWTGINYVVAATLESEPLPKWLAGVTDREAGMRDLGDAVRCVVTEDGWKLCWSELRQHELYDLNRDPGELDNLAFLPESVPRFAELAAMIRRWQENTGDLLELNLPPD